MIQPVKPKMAIYKLEPSRSIRHRPGPLQCLRSCANCVPKSCNDEQIYSKVDLLNIKSFDNLITKTNRRLQNYQSIHYHKGQLDVLKQASKSNPSQRLVYIVTANRINDIEYLKLILLEGQSVVDHAMQMPELLQVPTEKSIQQANLDGTSIAVMLKQKSCVVDKSSDDERFLDLEMLRQLLEVFITSAKNKQSPLIIPVSITKDHDIKTSFGFGSVALQVLEPFSIESYLERVRTEPISTRLTIHIYHDISKASIVLPPNLVAFILINLQRDFDGVHLQDLIEYVDWFRANSLDFDLHLGFTGNSANVVDFGLFVLKSYLKKDVSGVYFIRDEDRLMEYAGVVVPSVAYFGLLSRAIIIEHNKSNPDSILTHFNPNVAMRVSKVKVFETAEELSRKLETVIPCRPPCTLAITKIEDAFSKMSTFKRFFKLEEPRSRIVERVAYYTGDIEIDNDYNDKCRQNELFQASIVVTQRPYRLDRLNLLINSVYSYC